MKRPFIFLFVYLSIDLSISSCLNLSIYLEGYRDVGVRLEEGVQLHRLVRQVRNLLVELELRGTVRAIGLRGIVGAMGFRGIVGAMELKGTVGTTAP